MKHTYIKRYEFYDPPEDLTSRGRYISSTYACDAKSAMEKSWGKTFKFVGYYHKGSLYNTEHGQILVVRKKKE